MPKQPTVNVTLCLPPELAKLIEDRVNAQRASAKPGDGRVSFHSVTLRAVYDGLNVTPATVFGSTTKPQLKPGQRY